MSEPVKTKKPVIIFSIADERNKPYAKMLENSLRKFHPDIPFHLVEGEELEAYLKMDPSFYYRATPIVAEKFINDYDLVIKMDADSIIVDDISYIWKTQDYDMAGVLNYNREDAEEYGLVGGWGILPIEYVNCGLVALRNEKFIHDWKVWCTTPQFDRLQYKEQDGLNGMIYFGNWNIRILDHLDPLGGNNGWWGLISKGEWTKTILKDKKIIALKGDGSTPFPPKDVELKVLHWGGGQQSPDKMNYRKKFTQDIIERLDYLVSDKT